MRPPADAVFPLHSTPSVGPPTAVYHSVGLSGDELPVYFERYDPIEPASRPPVLMIHGGLHTGSCFQVTADGRPGWVDQFVARGYPVVVPDWPAHGRSGVACSSDLTGEKVCRALAGLVAELGSQVLLLTHSMGGALGWRLLELCVGQVVGVVALAPGPPGNIQPEADIVHETGAEVSIRTASGIVTIPARGTFVGDPDWARAKMIGASTQFPSEHISPYLASLTGTNARLVYERHNVAGTQVKVEEPSRLSGKRILVVTGTADADHPRDEDGAIVTWLSESGADATHLWLGDIGIEGNGHMLMLERNSPEICAAVLNLLDEEFGGSPG